ncbi:6,7-dimethyl-8-ribityllumazine synthase [soil metagenome]
MAGDAVSDRRAEPTLDGKGIKVAVVAGRFNDAITFRLLDGVTRGLDGLGAPAPVVEWVPGAFEIPLAAKAFAESASVDAVIGLGCVIRGATTHYEAVAGECAAGILRAGLATGLPIIFGVLTTETLDQALERSEGPGGHNVGEEGAQTAVEMVRLLERIGG